MKWFNQKKEAYKVIYEDKAFELESCDFIFHLYDGESVTYNFKEKLMEESFKYNNVLYRFKTQYNYCNTKNIRILKEYFADSLSKNLAIITDKFILKAMEIKSIEIKNIKTIVELVKQQPRLMEIK